MLVGEFLGVANKNKTVKKRNDKWDYTDIGNFFNQNTPFRE